jgi:hypothetical protein
VVGFQAPAAGQREAQVRFQFQVAALANLVRFHIELAAKRQFPLQLDEP